MNKEYRARFDLRVEPELRNLFQEYCKEKKLTISDAGREALEIYVSTKKFKESFLEYIQNPEFFSGFNAFYENLPCDIKNEFEEFLGPEEEKLVAKTPKQLLKVLRVVTNRGQKAIERKM